MAWECACRVGIHKWVKGSITVVGVGGGKEMERDRIG